MGNHPAKSCVGSCIYRRTAPTCHLASEISGLYVRRFFVGLTRVFCWRRRVVCCFFGAYRCFFGRGTLLGVPLFGLKSRRWWPWRLGNDSVTIFDRFGLPFGAARGSLLRAFGREKLHMGRKESFLGALLGDSEQVPKEHPKLVKNRTVWGVPEV